MPKEDPFVFEISLSVLDHLGRSLYRSFTTVLGEAVSNSWDADAENVHIFIDRESNSFSIRDDGIGMTTSDFQNKFLKIGYSKRRDGGSTSPKGRPYIGRKGIGKLALLSCAEKVTIISKVEGGEYIGGTIDNSGLNEAITEDLKPSDYPLENWEMGPFEEITAGHSHGTIIRFEGIKEGINHSLTFLKKIIALYFRFSLLDSSFSIFVDNEKITHEHLSDLAEHTQFLWKINGHADPFVQGLEERFTTEQNEVKDVALEGEVSGFIASVKKPRDLKIMTTEERVGIDLFVNGRLRERDITKHIPTARVAESYFYGQVHFNALDEAETDRFTSSREGIVANDPKYQSFLEKLRTLVISIAGDWDKWRIQHGDDGDPENEDLTKKRRASLSLYNAISKGYTPAVAGPEKEKVEAWSTLLRDDAAFSYESFAEIFMAENLVRKFIGDKGIFPTPQQAEIDKWRRVETAAKVTANLTIDLRLSDDDLFYLDMEPLVDLAEPRPRTGHHNTLLDDEKVFTPIRNAVMHTSLLTDEAKRRLTTVFDNIKARIVRLLT